MATPATATAILDSVMNDFTAMRPDLNEEDARRPRYVFNPFRTKRLKPADQGQFGITALYQGIIQPFFPFDKPDSDFEEVMRTREGDLTASQGIDRMRLFRRNPKQVVSAVVKLFGNLGDTPTGVMEIEALRGHDSSLVRQMQAALLPEVYTTGAAQLAQLQSVNLAGKPPLFEATRDALILSTSASITWSEAHYRNLLVQMQVAANVGGKRLSKLDIAVCAWLEYAVPEVQSKLVQNQPQQAVTVSQVVKPVIQCESCGHESNLLANGNPPKFCGVCRESFMVQAADIELTATNTQPFVATSGGISFDPENPMGEAAPPTDRQAKLQQKQIQSQMRHGK